MAIFLYHFITESRHAFPATERMNFQTPDHDAGLRHKNQYRIMNMDKGFTSPQNTPLVNNA
jgi:hypothetical protein